MNSYASFNEDYEIETEFLGRKIVIDVNFCGYAELTDYSSGNYWNPTEYDYEVGVDDYEIVTIYDNEDKYEYKEITDGFTELQYKMLDDLVYERLLEYVNDYCDWDFS